MPDKVSLRAREAPTLVIVACEIPEPNVAGHLASTYAFLNHMQGQGFEIVIVLISGYLEFRTRDYAKHYPPARTRIVGRDVIWLFGRVWVKSEFRASLHRWKDRVLRLLGLGRLMKQQPTPVPAEHDEVVGEFACEVEARYAGRVMNRIKPAVVVIDTVFLTSVLDHLDTETRTMVLTHDVFHRRLQSLSARGYRVGPKGFSREQEAALLARFDIIVANQPEEAGVLRDMAPGNVVVTGGMPVAFIPSDPEQRVPGRLIFVGSEGLTNGDGLRWFIDRVWPRTKQAVPHAELHVYGGVCNMLAGTDSEGVVLHGFAPDLTAAYQEASVSIAPLKAGSGLKIKVLEYLSYGLPCVTTSVGVQGFHPSPERPLLVADAEEAFAAHTIRLCTDPPFLEEMQRRTESYLRYYAPDRVLPRDRRVPLARTDFGNHRVRRDRDRRVSCCFLQRTPEFLRVAVDPQRSVDPFPKLKPRASEAEK